MFLFCLFVVGFVVGWGNGNRRLTTTTILYFFYYYHDYYEVGPFWEDEIRSLGAREGGSERYADYGYP
jgi:hypothetical protein